MRESGEKKEQCRSDLGDSRDDITVGVLLKFPADHWKVELSWIHLKRLDGMNREETVGM